MKGEDNHTEVDLTVPRSGKVVHSRRLLIKALKEGNTYAQSDTSGIKQFIHYKHRKTTNNQVSG